MVQGCYLKGRFPALAAISITLEDYLTGKEHVQKNNLFDPTIYCASLYSGFWMGAGELQNLLSQRMLDKDLSACCHLPAAQRRRHGAQAGINGEMILCLLR